MSREDLACWALRYPDQTLGLDSAGWELLIRQARRADVLARIGVQLHKLGILEQVPNAPLARVWAAVTSAQAQHREVLREAEFIAVALRDVSTSVVLLKGAAYVVAGLSAAQGRLFSDTDILVPKSALPDVETQLMLNGWLGSHHDDYDQRYYREWMHEIPPMEHMQRHTVLDVHHNILPLTVRRPPEAQKLIDKAKTLDRFPGLKVLAPADMVLHSMAHLFHNDDLSHGLRDLSDLDLLLKQFSVDKGFWSDLLSRSEALCLERSLFYGLWATSTFIGTPIPPYVMAETNRFAPGWPASVWMPFLWRRGLRTPHITAALPLTGLAKFALYVRAHWLRMPPFMLARHLSNKAWMRVLASKTPLAP